MITLLALQDIQKGQRFAYNEKMLNVPAATKNGIVPEVTGIVEAIEDVKAKHSAQFKVIM